MKIAKPLFMKISGYLIGLLVLASWGQAQANGASGGLNNPRAKINNQMQRGYYYVRTHHTKSPDSPPKQMDPLNSPLAQFKPRRASPAQIAALRARGDNASLGNKLFPKIEPHQPNFFSRWGRWVWGFFFTKN